jgi:hypothetical protein
MAGFRWLIDRVSGRIRAWISPRPAAYSFTYQPTWTAVGESAPMGAAERRDEVAGEAPADAPLPILDLRLAANDPLAARRATAARRAALIAAFDGGHPVKRRAQLLDRDDKLDMLFDSVLDQGLHAIIHGPRGSGKTSLVRIFGDYADEQGAVVIYQSCEPTGAFAPLLASHLRHIPASVLRPGGGTAVTTFLARHPDFGPRALADLLAEWVSAPIILILDEFDRVEDAQAQAAIATFMKLIADASVPVRIILVGIAQSVDDLIASHMSLRRHMASVRISRLSDDSIAEIIEQGAVSSGVAFTADARNLIAQVAYGSPYHTRLFALNAGLAMLNLKRDAVDRSVALAGLSRSLDQWGELNSNDWALFQNLCDSEPAFRQQLVAIAQLAIRDNGLSSADLPISSDLAKVLDEALVHDAREASRMLFKDSLAPQFLLSLLALRDEQDLDIGAPVADAARKGA